MNHRLLLFFFAALLATLFAYSLGGSGPVQPRVVSAAVNCDDTHRLRIDIIDDDTDGLLSVEGTEVLISPDPLGGDQDEVEFEDGESDDDSSEPGRIEFADACEISDEGGDPAVYSITVKDLPGSCDLVGANTQSTALTANRTVTFHVKDCEIEADIVISITAVDRTISCGSTTGLTVQVTSNGERVPNGTDIQLSTNLGRVSPTDLETVNGGAFATYQAPNSRSGTAVVSAKALDEETSIRIDIDCPAGNPGPAVLNFPVTVCSGNRANVTFSWTPTAGADLQFLDLSLADNDFAPGTFIGVGPLSSGATEFTWNGLLQDRPHFWRVNALTSKGWVAATGAFVPCGDPAIRGVTYSCIGNNRAAVTFYWAPASPQAFSSWLDLSLFNNGFAPGSFVGAGPLGTTTQLTWTGILGGYQHYWRINSLFGNGWHPSATGTFYPNC